MGNACPGCEEKRKQGAVLPGPSSAMRDDAEESNISSISIPPGRGLDHVLLVSKNHTLQFDPRVTVDFSVTDFRAFCLLLHKEHGAILLHCTRKRNKPPHYQLPGGHVDAVEFERVCHNRSSTVTQEQLYLASRMGCAREVYEETGIELRQQLDRICPMILHDSPHKEHLMNEFKHRLFFVCEVMDTDFIAAKEHLSGSVRFSALPDDYSCNLQLQLSVEHSGFRFCHDPNAVIEKLRYHSGGKVQTAVGMALNFDIPAKE